VNNIVYSRALERAAEILGGTDALRAYLDVSTVELSAWISGEAKPPDRVFLRVADLLSERQLQSLQQRANSP